MKIDRHRRAELLDETARKTLTVLDAIVGAGLLDKPHLEPEAQEGHSKALWLLAMLRDTVAADLRSIEDAAEEQRI